MTWGDAATWVLGAAGVVGAITAILTAGRKVAVLLRRAVHLVDDMAGEPGRPGVEARPGLMERVSTLEGVVEEVRHEVQHNDGGSLKDAVRRTENTVSNLAQRVDGLSAAPRRGQGD